jgi:hypothetical protein
MESFRSSEQSSDELHARHVWLVTSQIGASAGQSDSVEQAAARPSRAKAIANVSAPTQRT